VPGHVEAGKAIYVLWINWGSFTFAFSLPAHINSPLSPCYHSSRSLEVVSLS
jgi:hypothetical protein